MNARARPHDLEIQQQTVLIFIGSVAQLPQTSLSLGKSPSRKHVTPYKIPEQKHVANHVKQEVKKKLPFSY